MSDSSPGMGHGQRFAQSIASCSDTHRQIQYPATNSFVSANGPSVTVRWSPEKVNGEWLFRGTRVPVRALFENLEGGATINDFLEWFPGVSREQAELVLRHAELSLTVA